jgi:hypothetical protein
VANVHDVEVEEMQRLVRDAIPQVAREQSTLLINVTLYLTEKKSNRPVTGLGSALIRSVQIMAEQIAKDSAEYRKSLERLQEGIRGERGGVYVLMRETRQDTDRFLKENQFPHAKVAYEDAKQALDKVRAAATGSGTQQDLSELSQKLLDKLSTHLKETETVQNAFVSKHEKKFFGPVGPDIKSALLELEQWREWESQFKAQDLDAKLREFRNAQNGIIDTTLAELRDEETRELISGWIRKDIERFGKATEAWLKEYDEALSVIREREKMAKDLE